MEKEMVRGTIELTEGGATLPFKVEIYSQYPFQFHEVETIRFINETLMSYNHINADGSVCVHTMHHPQLGEKIALDLNGLKHWMINYYLNQKKDELYEHIIVGSQAFNGKKYAFLFTDTEHTFTKGSYGYCHYTPLTEGDWKSERIVTNLVQGFIIKGKIASCNWNSLYRQMNKKEAVYYFTDAPPVKSGRFALDNFKDLETYYTQEFMRFLDQVSKRLIHQATGIDFVPLLIGYPIKGAEIHWQVILIPLDAFPGYGQKLSGGKIWLARLKDQPIIWGMTRNCSYGYFFGRGAFHKKITDARILVIGVGAIGSMVATSLVRGGARNITLVDHDLKEPENVCRSEYAFLTGMQAKIKELSTHLLAISPFVEVSSSEDLMDFVKTVVNTPQWLRPIEEHLNQFDIIFDCSTDNDVAYLFSQFEITGEIFSLSITNHAKELVCGGKHNLYSWLRQIFNQLQPDADDLYQPTGCWSPTFKASYSDLSALVHFALRHINNCFEQTMPVRHFYLSTSNYNGFQIKLNQY